MGGSQLGVEGVAEISTASAFRALSLMRCMVDMTEASATEEGCPRSGCGSPVKRDRKHLGEADKSCRDETERNLDK